MESIIRDINLAESGERKIEWVKRNCDLLRMLEEEFSKTKPFAGKKLLCPYIWRQKLLTFVRYCRPVALKCM